MTPRYFKLAGILAVPASSGEWPGWFELHEADRVVAQTDVGDCFVATEFLGRCWRTLGIAESINRPENRP